MHAFESLDFPFADLLRSVDAVVTKPGYGTFTEATCNGAAVIYQRRDDWPEQDCLIEWLHQHARCAEVTAADLMAGNLGPALESCLQRAVPPAPTFDGAEMAARHLATLLA
jgi:UDP-N-acetylglucosamine:LPS N-acetylglucosamine transferase